MKRIVLFAALAFATETFAAATQVIPDQAKKDFLQGNFQVPAAQCTGSGVPSPCCTGAGAGASCPVYKIALVTSASNTSTSTTTFAGVTNEVTGTGYTAGGATLSGYSVTIAANHACLTFTSPVTWSNATITARAAVVYCASGCPALDVIAVYCLDGSSCAADTVSSSSTFSVTLPAGLFCGN